MDIRNDGYSRLASSKVDVICWNLPRILLPARAEGCLEMIRKGKKTDKFLDLGTYIWTTAQHARNDGRDSSARDE
jgi:hypothetical protein